MDLIFAAAVGALVTVVVAAITRYWDRTDEKKTEQRKATADHAEWLRGERLRVYAEFVRTGRAVSQEVVDADGKVTSGNWQSVWRPKFMMHLQELGGPCAEISIIGHADVYAVTSEFELAVLACMKDLEAGRHPHADAEAQGRMRSLGHLQGQVAALAGSHLASPSGTASLAPRLSGETLGTSDPDA